MVKLTAYISEKISQPILSAEPVSGGDISSAYLLHTTSQKYFLKVNSKPFAYEMFLAEEKGLQFIKSTNTIAVPEVYRVDKQDEISFLLMEFIPSKRSDANNFRNLGMNLAKLHSVSASEFGFSNDNFIGSLPQSNTSHQNWAEFYWNERISPQLQMAVQRKELKQNEIPETVKAIETFQKYFPDVKPSLLHGDLWSGNFLISEDGIPYLIDPAVYFGHSMVDIAMTKLFGGFHPEFYDAYHDIIPKTSFYDAQIELYQLYYLLVHLNLFGAGYRSSVTSILKRYF